MKGRPIWGQLVPYGQVWRSGANEATTITFDQPVMVEGQPLAAGTYSLFTIPTEKQWTMIFNKTAKQWGAFKYDDKQDALRVTVTPQKGHYPRRAAHVRRNAHGPHVALGEHGPCPLPSSNSASLLLIMPKRPSRSSAERSLWLFSGV